jgi:hypothetical protein
MEHGPLPRHDYLIAQAKTVMAVGVVANDTLMAVRKNSIGDGVSSVFCLAGLWHGAAERAGPSRGAERKWGLRIGREVEFGE